METPSSFAICYHARSSRLCLTKSVAPKFESREPAFLPAGSLRSRLRTSTLRAPARSSSSLHIRRAARWQRYLRDARPISLLRRLRAHALLKPTVELVERGGNGDPRVLLLLLLLLLLRSL